MLHWPRARSSWQGRPSIYTAPGYPAWSRSVHQDTWHSSFLRANLCSQHLPSSLPCAADLCVSMSCLFPVCRAGEVAYRCQAGWTRHRAGQGRMSHQHQVQSHIITICWHCWQRQVAVPAELHDPRVFASSGEGGSLLGDSVNAQPCKAVMGSLPLPATAVPR